MSLASQRDAPSFEVLVGVRKPGPEWNEVVALCPGARIVKVHGNAGAARNELVEEAGGEILLFLDDDVTAHPALLARLTKLVQTHQDVEVFGGPNLTPAHSSFFQTVQGAVLASLVGSGPVRKRYGKHPPGHADEMFFILCNLAIRQRSMAPFGEELVCAEENALLLAMSRRGLAMFYDPQLIVFHDRRSDIAGFASQMLKYGRGRGQIIGGNPLTARIPFLVPALFAVYVALLPVLVASNALAVAPLAIYVSAALANAIKIAMTIGRVAAMPLALAMTFVLHAAYGFGLLRGLFAPGHKLPRASGAPVVEHKLAAVGENYDLSERPE